MRGNQAGDWRELCKEVAREYDPEKLLDLMRQINRALSQQREIALRVAMGAQPFQLLAAAPPQARHPPALPFLPCLKGPGWHRAKPAPGLVGHQTPRRHHARSGRGGHRW